MLTKQQRDHSSNNLTTQTKMEVELGINKMTFVAKLKSSITKREKKTPTSRKDANKTPESTTTSNSEPDYEILPPLVLDPDQYETRYAMPVFEATASC
jgi:hypothetical protein